VSHWKPEAKFSYKALMQLWAFGFRIFLSNLLNLAFGKLDTLIIAKLFTPTLLGLFNRAQALDKMVISYSSGSLMSVLFPILSKVKNNLPRFQNIIIKSLGIILFIVFLLLGGLYLISHELIILLFGEKWLQSASYFQILVLSGFGFPISALLVNVLISRGNSKAFLRLEIYKKMIASVNFIVLYFYGIDVYLYGLIIQASLSISLNIIFVSREIKLPFHMFFKPIIIQMGITIFAVSIIIILTQNIESIAIIILAIKGILFTCLYVLLNYLMKTNSFTYFLEQIMPIIQKKFRNKVKD
jgi:O-antigen/teichoic acid export membrane protein